MDGPDDIGECTDLDFQFDAVPADYDAHTERLQLVAPFRCIRCINQCIPAIRCSLGESRCSTIFQDARTNMTTTSRQPTLLMGSRDRLPVSFTMSSTGPPAGVLPSTSTSPLAPTHHQVSCASQRMRLLTCFQVVVLYVVRRRLVNRWEIYRA